jgi:excisionase family DNA binding protein
MTTNKRDELLVAEASRVASQGHDGPTLHCGDLLSVDEAAELATVRPSTIRAWLGAGRLPRVKVGRCTRILRRDLEEFIRAGSASPGGSNRA